MVDPKLKKPLKAGTVVDTDEGTPIKLKAEKGRNNGGAVQTGTGAGLSAGGTILISREKARPLSVTVAPLREFSNALSQRPAAVLLISDPDKNPSLPVDLLRVCYGMTSADDEQVRLSIENDVRLAFGRHGTRLLVRAAGRVLRELESDQDGNSLRRRRSLLVGCPLHQP